MRTRAITDKELKALRQALPWRDGLAMQIMRDTGLRVSDMLELRVSDLNKPTIRVVEKKTGKTRVVHLRPATRRELLKYVQGRSQTDHIIRCNRSTLYRSIHSTALQLGMERISAHSARKAYAKAFARKHGLRAAQEELKHDYISTTLIYVHDIPP
jgi:integrase